MATAGYGALASALPDHAFRGPSLEAGPQTGFYQVITMGQSTTGISQTDAIIGIVKLPYEFVICDISWFTNATGGTPNFEVSHNSSAAIDTNETAVIAAVNLGASPYGNKQGSDILVRTISQGQYLIAHANTGGAATIPDLTVTITGYCTQHVDMIEPGD